MLRYHSTFFENNDRVAKPKCFVDVVGHKEDRFPQFLLEAQELVLQVPTDDRINSSEGLIHEQNVRI